MVERRKGLLPTLDGWRAIAILAVLLDHLSLSREASPLTSLLRYGSHGVDVFFAISGFLICNRLISEERRYGAVSIRGFYIRRAFRILPVFLSYLLFVVCLGSVQWDAWRAALLLFRNYIPTTTDWITGHFWSLAVEEHFYLIMPFLFVLARKRRVTAFLSLAALIVIWTEIDSSLHLITVGETRFRTDYRMPALLMGCVAALIFANYRKALERLPGPAFLVPGLVLLFVALEFIPKPLRFALQAPLFPVILISTTLRPESLLSRALQLRPLEWVGRVSYGLYVWQQFFLSAAPDRLPVQRLPFNIPLLILIVLVSYYWMEEPFVRLGHRLSARQAAPALSKTAVAGGKAIAPEL